MVRLFNYPKILITMNGSAREWEYSCPHCFKPIKWDESGQLSPFNCPGCHERMMDISKLINDSDWRTRYHEEEESKVICGTSTLT